MLKQIANHALTVAATLSALFLATVLFAVITLNTQTPAEDLYDFLTCPHTGIEAIACGVLNNH